MCFFHDSLWDGDVAVVAYDFITGCRDHLPVCCFLYSCFVSSFRSLPGLVKMSFRRRHTNGWVHSEPLERDAWEVDEVSMYDCLLHGRDGWRKQACMGISYQVCNRQVTKSIDAFVVKLRFRGNVFGRFRFLPHVNCVHSGLGVLLPP